MHPNAFQQQSLAADQAQAEAAARVEAQLGRLEQGLALVTQQLESLLAARANAKPPKRSETP